MPEEEEGADFCSKSIFAVNRSVQRILVGTVQRSTLEKRRIIIIGRFVLESCVLYVVYFLLFNIISSLGRNGSPVLSNC